MAQKSIKSYSSIRYPKYWMRAKIFSVIRHRLLPPSFAHRQAVSRQSQ